MCETRRPRAWLSVPAIRTRVSCARSTSSRACEPIPRCGRACPRIRTRSACKFALLPSDAGRIPFAPMSIRDQPLATTEFLAVDVETNGRAGELCELTEVGAVLVGGGELHETYESLVRVEQPLSRGIERFTGITQAMVDAAPEPAGVLEELVEMVRGRVLIADRKSTRLNSSHVEISYAVFCLKKKKQ